MPKIACTDEVLGREMLNYRMLGRVSRSTRRGTSVDESKENVADLLRRYESLFTCMSTKQVHLQSEAIPKMEWTCC